jgi:hypothetical protein
MVASVDCCSWDRAPALVRDPRDVGDERRFCVDLLDRDRDALLVARLLFDDLDEVPLDRRLLDEPFFELLVDPLVELLLGEPVDRELRVLVWAMNALLTGSFSPLCLGRALGCTRDVGDKPSTRPNILHIARSDQSVGATQGTVEQRAGDRLDGVVPSRPPPPTRDLRWNR